MAPAFSSTREALGFAAIVGFFILSPLLCGKWAAPPREEIYSSLGWRTFMTYVDQVIYHEKGDIDVAFIGSSHIGNDVDTPYVQQALSSALGRPATVRTLSWANAGNDAVYIIARDLLQQRHVKMLVFYDDEAPNQPHVTAWRWLRWHDDASELAGLPVQTKLAYYYGSILGLPRNLLNNLQPNLPEPSPSETFFRQDLHAVYPPDVLGSYCFQVSYLDRPDLFHPYTPQTQAQSSDVRVFSTATADDFNFSGPSQPLQTYFASKLLSLAKSKSVQLVCLSLPLRADRNDDKIQQGPLWPDTFKGQADLVGISPARLFSGLGDEQVDQLYRDPVHMNQNGQAYFTRLITPQLIQLYENANR